MIFVDTNYFLRFLLEDIPEQHLEAKRVFKEAALANFNLVTSLIVIFEIYWILKRTFHKSREELFLILTGILDMRSLEIAERDLLTNSAFLFHNTNLSLEDCYNLVYARERKVKDFKTFDQKLKKHFNSID